MNFGGNPVLFGGINMKIGGNPIRLGEKKDRSWRKIARNLAEIRSKST
jgi:hypothetical protein